MAKRTITAVDLYCGAGGTSSGLVLACNQIDAKLQLLAINHWDVAIATHSANHPGAEHRCESLDNVDPRKAVPGGRLNLLLASPECTHHSVARGGRPINDQSRASAWHIVRWAEALYIDTILIENVKEFRSWGPIGANGRPLESKRGETFRAFITALRSLGYKVDYRVLNAADYGDPTTRERLFIMARRGGKKISWPSPSHAPIGKDLMFGSFKPWRTAREIIDWDLKGKNIFERKKPLADKTLRRIAAGAKKFWGVDLEPFLVILRNNQDAQSLDRPVPTLTTSGANFGIAEPFVMGQQSKSSPRSIDDPIPTVATRGAISLVEPFIVGAGGPVGKSRPRSVDEPLSTVLTQNHSALIEPFLVTVNHGDTGSGSPGSRCHSVDNPLRTVTTIRNQGLVEPFIVPNFGEREGQEPRVHGIDSPLPTVTGHGAGCLVEPFFFAHQRKQNPQSVDSPLNTVTATSSDFALVEPFLVKFNGTATARPVNEPLDAVTTKDRFALVQTDQGPVAIGIRFRMLQPHELARAMSFPDDYKFSGNREDKVKQIGNAVPVNLSRALCLEVLQ